MAVYTDVSDGELQSFLESYGMGRLISFKGIAEGVENSNFLVETEKGRFILTLYEKRVSAADLPYFLGLMEHLADKGLPCPLPVHDLEGKALRELAGRPAALITFLDGISARRPSTAQCAALGDVLGRLHKAGADFQMRRENSLGPDGWAQLFEAVKMEANGIIPDLADELEDELDALSGKWPEDLPEGVIHADLFPDNVLFLDSKVSGLIDFYFACNDQLAYDVVICLNAWCFEPDVSFNVTKSRALLEAYQAVRPLSAAEREALPILARGAALRFLLTRTYDWLNRDAGALVQPKKPDEYLRKLRFHRQVRSASDYGLDES
ncbi:homoserine kinase [Methyloligella solikamskensis]|uniref:Homoserine kinase n=1 Tax=Methyloligella solikamskensis TaxID=1177756 RepID=A0ABW3JEY2_9HYPH